MPKRSDEESAKQSPRQEIERLSDYDGTVRMMLGNTMPV